MRLIIVNVRIRYVIPCLIHIHCMVIPPPKMHCLPIVTRSDGDDMASRVSTSANLVLGLDELNAYGSIQYEDIVFD